MGRNAKLRQQRKQSGSKINAVRFLHSQPESSTVPQEERSEAGKPSSFLGKLFDRFKPSKKTDTNQPYVASSDAYQFSECYRLLIGALAWEGHEKFGRGLLLVQDGIESFEAEYVPISKLRPSLRPLDLEPKDLTAITNMVKAYDPQIGLMLLFVSQEGAIDAYLASHLDPLPSESYRLRQQQMAEADRTPESQ